MFGENNHQDLSRPGHFARREALREVGLFDLREKSQKPRQ
jgi:hypothetical protein